MFVTNCISTTKIQKISEITNFFRHYFLSRTEVRIKKVALFEGDFFILFIPTQLSKVVLKRCHNIHGLHPSPY